MADSVADKARKARNRASDENYAYGSSSGRTDKMVMDLTRKKKPSLAEKIAGRYPNAEEKRAANLVQQRRRIDTAKTAARATAIENRTTKKKAADTLKTGVSGGPAKKSAPKPTTKKAAAGTPMAKKTAKAPTKPVNPSTKKTPMPKVTKKPEKMTPQDAAMKKILEKKYGKIYG